MWLSVAALGLAGAADMVSVYVRETLIQLWTPDAVRGRVNAVNMVFVGASNELGEFRAGSVAALIGVVPAVVLGGIGTIAVAAPVDEVVPGFAQGPPPQRPGVRSHLGSFNWRTAARDSPRDAAVIERPDLARGSAWPIGIAKLMRPG